MKDIDRGPRRASRDTAERSGSVCGTLLRCDGLGILIQGESGAGKTTCGLEVVLQGGRLVSDDIVEVRRVHDDRLIGRSPVETRGLIEIKGVGLVHIGKLLGSSAVAPEGPIHLVIEFSREVKRTRGPRRRSRCLLGIEIPFYRLGERRTMDAVTLIKRFLKNRKRP